MSQSLELHGRTGVSYWLHEPFRFTGHAEVDDRLSGFPVAVFQPEQRSPAETPVVFMLQGMAAPYQWNGYLVPTLLDMGIGCVLFDAPLGGERSLARTHMGDILGEARALAQRGILPRGELFPAVLNAVARDFTRIIGLIEELHGLTDPRRALFGVSLGALLSGYAFTRDGIGERLLAVIGHTDLVRFARSYVAAYATRAATLPLRLFGRRFATMLGPRGIPLGFLTMIAEQTGRQSIASNPMTYLDRVGPGRRARFLVGAEDRFVRPADAIACAGRFRDGECLVIPGMGHGGSKFNRPFVEEVRNFIGTQLGDWRW
jgi:hypothetical protein